MDEATNKNGEPGGTETRGQTPLLTAVIPTRNEERNIGKCIDALAGAGGWIETIVVDNASDDRTQEIARERDVRVVEQGPERSAQRNRGWREARTPFVCFLDADMRMLPETLEEIRHRISAPDAPDALYIREVRVGRGWWIRVRNFERSFYDATCIDALRVFRRELLEKTGGYDETITGEEDWDLDRLCLAAGARVALTDGALLHDEGEFSWRRHLRKKAYYSGTMDRYRAKWNNDATIRKQLGIGYRFFGVFLENGKWRRALAHPLMMASIFAERAIVGFTYLLHRR